MNDSNRMNNSNQSTMELPGPLLPALRKVSQSVRNASDFTIETVATPFRSIEHLLSGKPLRRPNRRSPMSTRHDDRLEIRETYPHQERAALEAGWDDPELDIYGEISELEG